MSDLINISDYILLEDEYILVVNKPAGLMVEPDRNGYPNLQQQVKKYLKPFAQQSEPVYAQHIHRLDRPVSGIILFAKQKLVLKNLSEQFAERRVKKYYQALTANAPHTLTGKLEHWHRKEKKKAMLFNENLPYTEKAILHFDVQAISQNKYQWHIELHTGKYHQIRAQLSSINCAIIGDNLYGSDETYKPNCIALHASRFEFQHPITNQNIVIEKGNDFLTN